jgi:hypothetical protein
MPYDNSTFQLIGPAIMHKVRRSYLNFFTCAKVLKQILRWISYWWGVLYNTHTCTHTCSIIYLHTALLSIAICSLDNRQLFTSDDYIDSYRCQHYRDLH